MRGRAIRISPARRLVIDFMRLSRDIPLVSVERRMRLEPVVRARSKCAQRALWMSIFTKAYGTVSRNFPELRRAYVKLPWPHFYEYAKPVAMLPLGIEYCGEEGIFTIRIGNPGAMRLSDIDSRIRNAKAAPIEKVADFRRLQRISRLPLPVRYPLQWLGLNLGRQRANFFGTFLIGGVSELGIESQHMLSPISNSLSYGVISPDGDVNVRMYWDHRVMDGAVVARALAQLERTLNGEIADELRQTPTLSA
jgi:hypothetical protein